MKSPPASRPWRPLLSLVVAAACLGSPPPSSGRAPSCPLLEPANLLAWCIVPYDSAQRSPAQRMAMLQRLGFSQYVWDWRAEHLPQLPEEMAAARAAGVRLRGLWLWLDDAHDSVGTLGAHNRAVLAAAAQAREPFEFWVGMHDNVFADLDDTARLAKATALVAYIRDEARAVGGTIALYNHGGWYGEPENQVRIINAVGDPSVGMVYNFHHGHEHIERFAEFLPLILPHLRAVNLNGMRPEGPKILTIGAGSKERTMLDALKRAGYAGPIGILGHVEGADVELILRANLDGLRTLAGPAEASP